MLQGGKGDFSRAGAPSFSRRVGAACDLRGTSHDRSGEWTCCVAQNAAKKNRGSMAPEQQRQEENGDVAALPHTYRK